jgi:hypothetical protein
VVHPSNLRYSGCRGRRSQFEAIWDKVSKNLSQKQTNRKPCKQARHGWLTPVILATQEAEIRRITV